MRRLIGLSGLRLQEADVADVQDRRGLSPEADWALALLTALRGEAVPAVPTGPNPIGDAAGLNDIERSHGLWLLRRAFEQQPRTFEDRIERAAPRRKFPFAGDGAPFGMSAPGPYTISEGPEYNKWDEALREKGIIRIPKELDGPQEWLNADHFRKMLEQGGIGRRDEPDGSVILYKMNLGS
jgi:hypothetical protein